MAPGLGECVPTTVRRFPQPHCIAVTILLLCNLLQACSATHGARLVVFNRVPKCGSTTLETIIMKQAHQACGGGHKYSMLDAPLMVTDVAQCFGCVCTASICICKIQGLRQPHARRQGSANSRTGAERSSKAAKANALRSPHALH